MKKISTLINQIEETLLFLQTGKKVMARDLFESTIKTTFKEACTENTEETFQLEMFISELDDYINEPAVQILNATTLDELIKSFVEIKQNLNNKHN